MSELPTLDTAKILEREVLKYRKLYQDSLQREAYLEIMAEALRDERDEARAALEASIKSTEE